MEKNKVWQTGKVLEKFGFGYCDWEGFADDEGHEKLVREAISCIEVDGELRQVLGDLVLHYVFQFRDAVGENPSLDFVREIACFLHASKFEIEIQVVPRMAGSST